jgi:hypothetical protein
MIFGNVTPLYVSRDRKNGTGRLSETLHALDVSRALDSSSPELNYLYGKYYLLTVGGKMAMSYFNRSLAKEPSNSAVYNERAIVKIRLKDYAGAIEGENKAIVIDSTDHSSEASLYGR